MGFQELLIETIVNSDRKEAGRLIDKWMEDHSYDCLLIDVLGPVLRIVGELWQEEDFSLAHAYVAAKIVEDAFEKYSSHEGDNSHNTGTKGPVVLGNIEDDCHPLGRRLVATFLRADGWIVHDLGIDVEASKFIDHAIQVGAKVIGISAMIFTTAENILRVRAEIDKRGLTNRIQLAVGGAVFRLRPELVGHVGGDGTAVDALDAPALFTRLWDQAVGKEV